MASNNDFDNPSTDLFISNLPHGISQTGLQQLFIHYGEVVKIRKLNEACAIVKFSNKKASEEAFTNLNQIKPLFLKINYIAEEKDQKSSHPVSSESIENIDLIIGKYYELKDKISKRNCAHCHKVAFYKCQNCYEFYCSQTCQKNNWDNHQELCSRSLNESFSSNSQHKKINTRTNDENATFNTSFSSNSQKQKFNSRSNDHYESSFSTNTQHQMKSSNESLTHNPIQSLTNQMNSLKFQNNNKRFPGRNDNSKVYENRNNQNSSPSFKNIESNDEYVMTHFKDPNIIFLRSNSPSFVKAYKSMLERVHEYCIKSSKLRNPPKINDIVGCNYEGTWYRAIVDDIKNDKITITYIDFGNSQIIESNFARVLCSELKSLLPLTISCKNLKYINGLNIKAKQKLSEWVDNERPFNVKFLEGSNVEMFTLDGKNIEHIIQDLLNSSKRDDSDDEKSFQKTSTPITQKESFKFEENENVLENEVNDRLIYPNGLKFINRNPNDKFKFILFYQFDNKFQFGAEVSEALQNVNALTNEMTLYCENCDEKEYHPIENEIVLVKLEEEAEDECWYRAYCLNYYPEEKLYHVNFLDFGNVLKVKSTNIRKIPQKFIQESVIGITFMVEGCPQDLSGPRLFAFQNLFTLNQIYNVTVVKVEDAILTLKFDDLETEINEFFEQN